MRCPAVLCALLALSCGQPERSNPADPRAGGTSGDGIQLIAELPEGSGAAIAARIAAIRYRISAADIPRPLEGGMDLIGTQARARVAALQPGAARVFVVTAIDADDIPTFAAAETLDVSGQGEEPIVLQMQRLRGTLELTAALPPEIAVLEVLVDAAGDTLWRHFEVEGPLVERIAGIPTGADARVRLRGLDADEQILVQEERRADIRQDLLARIAFEVSGGSVRVVAHFPSYIPVVAVDRFSDAMGTFYRRSDNPDLPAPNEPVDFDAPRFLLRGFGPNGEAVTFYNFDVRPRQPGVLYEFIDRRGEPIAGQLPVFDRVPGADDYSDFWQVHQVRIVDRDYRANSLHDAGDIASAGLEIVPTEDIVNAVVVPAGSRARRRFDASTPTAVLDGWYRGQIVKYLRFENPQSTARVDFVSGQINTPQMYAFYDNNRDEKDGFALDPETGGTHNVVTRLPGEEGYSPLWVLQVFTLDVFARVADLASALDQAKNEENVLVLEDLVRVNAPIVGIGGE